MALFFSVVLFFRFDTPNSGKNEDKEPRHSDLNQADSPVSQSDFAAMAWGLELNPDRTQPELQLLHCMQKNKKRKEKNTRSELHALLGSKEMLTCCSTAQDATILRFSQDYFF